MSEERKEMMRAFGAEIINAPADDFEAAMPAAGGDESAGRTKRERIGRNSTHP